MSSALPVIVTDKMGPRELVTEGENGFIARDAVDFRQNLDLLIQDESLRKKMGTQARQYALTHRWEAVFHGLFHNYQRIINYS